MFGLPNPWLLLGLVLFWGASMGGAFLYGHHVADQSARVASLEADLSAQKALTAQREQDAKNAAQQAVLARQQYLDEQTLRQKLEQVLEQPDDVVPDEPRPPALEGVPPITSCSCPDAGLDGASLRRLQRLLDAAGGGAGSAAGAGGRVRPAGHSSHAP